MDQENLKTDAEYLFQEPCSKALIELRAELVKAKQAILAILAQEVNKARIDEWDYIETLRETSDNAMYESMQDRIKDLERLG